MDKITANINVIPCDYCGFEFLPNLAKGQKFCCNDCKVSHNNHVHYLKNRDKIIAKVIANRKNEQKLLSTLDNG